VTQMRTTWKGGLLGLHALTALHPGSGAALGVVDLPVQRERHTHWPNIAGSALKGILRDACREEIARREDLNDLDRFDDDREKDTPDQRRDRRKNSSKRKLADSTLMLNELFGPPSGQSAEFAGSVSVTDARLLAFPVRSLKGIFAWVTCPSALERLGRDLTLVEEGNSIPTLSFQPGPEQAVVGSGGCACVVNGGLVLEEFEFRGIEGDIRPIADWITANVLPATAAYAATRRRFPGQFVVLHDDDFTHFVRHATEVTARIGLDYDSKTVRSGALFYQEFLPAEAIFYSVVLVNAARTRVANRDAATLLQSLSAYLEHIPVLQVGGDETTGKGFCGIRFRTSSGGQS
jgi:CRISPR-associated protein Cmr4